MSILRKIFFAIFLVGLLFILSCMYSCYRFFTALETNSSQELQASSESLVPSADTNTPPFAAPPAPVETVAPYSPDAPIAPTGELVFLTPLITVLCKPGLFVLEVFSFVPDNLAEWGFAILFSWWSWGTSIRLLWVIPARQFGIGYSPQSFRYWLWLVPPWRTVYRFLRPVRRWIRYISFGRRDTDKWAGLIETLWHLYRRGRIFLGRVSILHLPFFQPVGIKGERHIACIAAPGSGKTTQLITMLAMYPGNLFVTDCDGQIINAIGKHLLAQGKKLIKYDPFNLAPDFASACWNLIAELDAALRYGPGAAVEFAATAAEALIKKVEGVNSWVYDEARIFLLSLILYVWLYAPPEHRNLVYLRKLLTLGDRERARPQDDPFMVLLADMILKPDFDGVIAAGASMMKRSMGKGDSKASVLATCIEQTAWLDFPRMAAECKASDAYCLESKTENACVFIVAPLSDIQGKLSGWVRALNVMTMYAYQRAVKERPKHPTLFALDEFVHLGPLPIIQTAAGGFRKYGIRLLTIAQTIGQLKAVYPHSWSDFLGTSECVIWMANGDQETREYLSNILGSTTQEAKVSGGLLSSLRAHLRREDRKLMSPGQLREYLKNNLIVTRADERAMRLKLEPYYTGLPTSWYEADHFYGETWARRCGRRIRQLIHRLLKGSRKTRPSIRNQNQ